MKTMILGMFVLGLAVFALFAVMTKSLEKM